MKEGLDNNNPDGRVDQENKWATLENVDMGKDDSVKEAVEYFSKNPDEIDRLARELVLARKDAKEGATWDKEKRAYIGEDGLARDWAHLVGQLKDNPESIKTAIGSLQELQEKADENDNESNDNEDGGEVSAVRKEYNLRLEWGRYARKIIADNPRQANEKLEDYNKRIRALIPTLDQYRKSEQAGKADLPDVGPNAPQESRIHTFAAPQARDEHLKATLNPDSDTTPPVTDTEPVTPNQDNGENTDAEDKEEKERIRKETVHFLRGRDAAIISAKYKTEVSGLDKKSDEELAALKTKVEEKIKVETNRVLTFLENTNLTKYFEALNIENVGLGEKPLHELVSIEKKIQEKMKEAPSDTKDDADASKDTIDDAKDDTGDDKDVADTGGENAEEIAEKNRRALRGREFAPYLRAANILPSAISKMSNEELADAYGKVEQLYQTAQKEAEAKKAAGAEPIADSKPSEEAAKNNAEKGEEKMAMKIGKHIVEVVTAESGEAQLERAQGDVAGYKEQIKKTRRKAFDLRQEMNDTSGFFARRRMAKEIAELEETADRMEKQLISAEQQRDNILASLNEQKAA